MNLHRVKARKLRYSLFSIALAVILLVSGQGSLAIGPMVGTNPNNPAPPRQKPKPGPQLESVPAALLDDSTVNPDTVTDVSGTITKFAVKGNRKIEADSILARIKSKVGGPYSPTLIREDVVQIFRTGYFYDVKVDREIDTESTATDKSVDQNGAKPEEKPVEPPPAPEKPAKGKKGKKSKAAEKAEPAAPAKNEHYKITYIVAEKPSITEITFEGLSEIKSDEALEATGLKNYEILNMNKVRDAIEKIQKLYEDKGYFLAKIEPRVEDVKPGETVKVIFSVKENDKVKVRKITFLGNQKLKDGYLKSKLMTQESGFFSMFGGGGGYKQEAFDRDMQYLRLLYFNEGYVQVKIDRPKVYVTPDKKDIYITIRIDEGEQFDVGDIDFSGDLLFPRDELAASIKLTQNKVFSYEVLQKDLSDLQAKYGDLGYAFANVIPRTKVNEKERKVDVTFEFDKGNKVYFGQINVVGNSKTRDKVVRRELRIYEGELYNETRKRKSLENIQRLGYFDDVVFKTSTPPEKPDILNIDIVVKERNTGSIQLGAGYGNATGFSLQGQVQQANFFGKGQKLSAGINYSQLYTSIFMNFTEPHYDDTDWAVGLDLYKSVANRYDYVENIIGGAVRVGHPLSDYVNLTFRYRYDQTWLDDSWVPTGVDANGNQVTNPATGTQSINITDEKLFPLHTADGDTGSLSTILEYDRRNDRVTPSDGSYASGSFEYAGLGGSLNYSKTSLTYRYYHKVFWDVVWRNNINYSAIYSNSGYPVPFNQKFLLGGPYTLRGYQFARIGIPKFSSYYYNQVYPYVNPTGNPGDDATQSIRPTGGSQQALIQTEFEFPLIAEANIKGVMFYDGGIADDDLDASNIYSDVGFGFRWFSPIGPLRFEWGFPLQYSAQSPSPMQFQFSIGAPF